MPYRNIFITNKASLKLKNNQLVVLNGEEFSFPVEDIKSIVLDNELTTLSARLISFLAESGVCLIVCGSKHMPSAQLIPVNVYCRVNKRIQLQFAQSKPKLKKIWKQIVQSKINNQAKCLALNGISENEKLLLISKSVQSGDETNREGYAASIYFKALFGSDFTRNSEIRVNAALNYGYAVIRAYISKTLISYGLETSLGVHHKNQLNSFNLADDIIEPFRPIVDFYVYKNFANQNNEFSTAEKAKLLMLLNCAVKIGNDKFSLSTAAEMLVQSLIASFETDEVKLKLPNLCDISFFDYD
ncbi:MAG: type II CRISPR-associated endonuclease Cas1 [Clostridiales bacterium]|nr:type II CRISPR-associated endonuclease Cas1 [Clostridiales bacterium]